MNFRLIFFKHSAQQTYVNVKDRSGFNARMYAKEGSIGPEVSNMSPHCYTTVISNMSSLEKCSALNILKHGNFDNAHNTEERSHKIPSSHIYSYTFLTEVQ